MSAVVSAGTIETAGSSDRIGSSDAHGAKRASNPISGLSSALGSNTHSGLAVVIGADTDNTGCIKDDSHQRTSVKSVYAAGDVVVGLDQISHAIGGGGVCQTPTQRLRTRRCNNQ